MSSSSPAGARSPTHFGRFWWQTCRMLADCPNQFTSLLFRTVHLFKQPTDGSRMDSRNAHAKFLHVLQVVREMHSQLQMDPSPLILNGFGTIYAENLSDMALSTLLRCSPPVACGNRDRPPFVLSHSQGKTISGKIRKYGVDSLF